MRGNDAVSRINLAGKFDCFADLASSWGNYATGHFFAGVSGRLCCKIVGRSVDDDGFAENFGNGKAVGQKHGESTPVCAEQRRKITRVIRMRTSVRIVMRAGVCKGVRFAGAFGSAVNMKGENWIRAGRMAFRQTGDLRPDDHTAARRIKQYPAVDELPQIVRAVQKAPCG